MEFFDPQLGTGPAEGFTDVLGAIVDENRVRQTILLDGFAEAVQDAEQVLLFVNLGVHDAASGIVDENGSIQLAWLFRRCCR